MGIKKPLVSISTLILAASTLGCTTAWAENDDSLSPFYEQTAWTYEEMANLNATIQPEIAEYCQNDNSPMCHDMYVGSKTGSIYRALSVYRQHGLTITAINPSQHTIKVAYDADVLSAGYSQKFSVKDLYIAQIEEGYYNPGLSYAMEFNDGLGLEHVNMLFMKNDATNDENWFPYDSEMEFYAPSLSMLTPSEREATDGIKYRNNLEVEYRMGSNASWGDYFDLSSCLNSLDYQDGMECRIIYGKGLYTYMPFAAETSTEARTSETTDSSDVKTDGMGNVGDATQIDGENTSPNNSPDATTVASTETAKLATTPDVIAAPDTGSAAGNYDEKTVEFPWWLGVIFATGIAALVWLFSPTRHENLKK